MKNSESNKAELKYIPPLKLNCGCGWDIRPNNEGWINIDLQIDQQIYPYHIDVCNNLEEYLPFKNNIFDFIFASHIIEHIQNYNQLIEEFHRVLKKSGILVIKVPEFPCRAAIADPTHVRYFVPESFYHLTNNNLGPTSSPLKGLFNLLYIESRRQEKPKIDCNMPGSYFTEIYCELEKNEKSINL